MPIVLALALACRTEPLTEHTLGFGGDLMLGRRINVALFDPEARDAALADLAPVLLDSDLTLVNGEGVISGGGAFGDKGEPRPHQYRAHPDAIALLVAAGVDVVAAGNNHAGDYGPDALREELDRLRIAGLDYTGAGHDLADARTPAYRRIGDTIVAFVGADLTMAERFAATAERPGILHLPGMRADRADDVVAALTEILSVARRHAHVVLFTPHWGDNFIEAPSGLTRTLARRLIDAGYDGILGHSAHVVQGIEIIDGRPVIYDAGNLLSDYGAGPGVVWQLRFTRAGITRVTAWPIEQNTNRTTFAKRTADATLEKLRSASSALGTALVVENGTATAACDPAGVAGASAEPPARPVPAAVRAAPAAILVDALPAGATPIEVAWPNGVRLLGYDLLLERLPVPKAGQVVTLYLDASAQPSRELRIRLEARGVEKRETEEHIPGDWLLPGDQWPLGQLLRDRTLMRLTLAAEGVVEFFVGLKDGELLEPATGARRDGRLVYLGSATYTPGAPRLFEVLAERGAR